MSQPYPAFELKIDMLVPFWLIQDYGLFNPCICAQQQFPVFLAVAGPDEERPGEQGSVGERT